MRNDAPFTRNVSSPYGAPMGRRSDLPLDTTAKLNLRRVPMVDGDYDAGGAYWGFVPSNPLWCAWDALTGEACYFRARNRTDARAHLPNARFFR